MNITSPLNTPVKNCDGNPVRILGARRKAAAISLLLLGALLLSALPVHAQIVIDPMDATSNMAHVGPRGPAIKLINGSGLSDPSIVETGDAVPVSWPTSGVGATANFLGVGTTGRFLFDLGAVYDVTALHIWNSQEDAGINNPEGDLRGMKDTTVYYSTTGIDINTLAGGANGGFYVMPKAPGAIYEGDTVTFGGAFSARYILLDVANNWGASGYMGAEEIRFIGAVPVPEPSALLLLSAAGLPALWILRRKRRDVVSAFKAP